MSKKRPTHRSSGHNPALPRLSSPGHYWLAGIHPVQMALDNPKRQKIQLLATQPALAKLRLPPRLPVQTVDPARLDALFPQGQTHQGVALEVAPLPAADVTAMLDSGQPLLMLDQVTDPQNIGAILRSAAAFGAGGVILQEKHSPRESTALAKTAAGALEVVPLLYVTNLSRTIVEAQQSGYWVIGLDGDAAHPTLAACKPQSKTLLVLGAEGTGLRRLVAEHCDQLARLPISAKMESLNVSNAAAIALYVVSGH
jgi:23S rRNA (guanosine2251-2'-O)-methyltransferase